MDRNSILEYGQALSLGRPFFPSKEWITYRCPFAPWKHQSGRDTTPSFGIHIDDGESHYWCLACKSKGTFASLAFQLGTLRKVDLVELGRRIQHTDLFGSPLRFKKWDDSRFSDEGEDHGVEAHFNYPRPEAEFSYPLAFWHPYLKGRGISAASALGLGLRYDEFQRRILFPVKDEWGQFVGFSGRSTELPDRVDDDGNPLDRGGRPYLKVRDYLELPKRRFFLGENRLRALNAGTICADGRAQSIILVEGLLDLARLADLGYRYVLALLGTALTPEKLAKLKRWRRHVIQFMDNDKAGHEATEANIKLLYGQVPVSRVIYPEGYEGADPGTLPTPVIHQMIKDYQFVYEKPAF